MRERRLDDDTALALAGSSAPGTHTPYPVYGRNWAEDFYRVLEHLQRLAARGSNLRVFLVEADDGTPDQSTLGVAAGAFTLAATAYAYAGSTAAVTNLTADDTYLIYAQDDGSGGVQIAAATAAAGWPVGDHLKLATAAKTAGVLQQPDDTVHRQELFTKA